MSRQSSVCPAQAALVLWPVGDTVGRGVLHRICFVHLSPQSFADLGLLVVRLAVGLTFAAHGAQKALGWWGGPGFAGWAGAVGRMRYSPAAFWAIVRRPPSLPAGSFSPRAC